MMPLDKYQLSQYTFNMYVIYLRYTNLVCYFSLFSLITPYQEKSQ